MNNRIGSTVILILASFHLAASEINSKHFQRNNNGLNQESVSHITTMLGSTASLPCNLKSSNKEDKVRLVLWFKEMEEKPIYTLDARDDNLEEARHWSDDKKLEGRGFFRTSVSPGRLVIDDVKPFDAGLYKCRVDFKIQPTTISHVNLTVNTPPGKPVILDESGSEVRLKLGPYKLGDSVMLKCLVVGGRPSPEVSWWRDHKLVDDSSVRPSEFKVENVFTLERLERSDLDSILTCQAKNSNESLPVSTSVKLDMTFGPETVSLVGVRHSLISGESYSIQCRAVGSRPPPSISWRLGDSLINVLQTRLETSNDHNVTTSTISLPAESDLHGKTISCTAGVPGLPDSNMEATTVLNVHFIKSARLSLGSSMRLEDVKEGDDVYLECEVSSNPRPDRVSWYKNGEAVRQDVSGGIILSNLTLVLQHVTPHTRGNYSCVADNSEGSVTSNSLPLEIKYKPVCSSSDQARKFQVGLNSQVEIVCEVESNPETELTFHWVFNTSQEMIDIQQDQMRANGTTSTVDYIPRTEMDYGNLLCWAENSVGLQTSPCVFQLVPAPPPLPVTNCSASEDAMTSVSVDCETQKTAEPVRMTFVMELWRTEDMTLVRNLTSRVGHWSLRGLEPGQEFKATVFTFNDVAATNRMNFTFHTLTSQYAESRVHIDSRPVTDKFSITPILGALIGVGVALSLVTFTIIIVICCKSKRSNRSDAGAPRGYREKLSSEECEELAPDVVPTSQVDDEDFSDYGQTLGRAPVCLTNRQTEHTSHQHIYTLMEAGDCCGVGGRLTTPTYVGGGQYSTLQSHRSNNYSHLRPGQHCYSPVRHNMHGNFSSLRRGVYHPSYGLEQCRSEGRHQAKLPSVSPSYTTGLSTGSSAVSSTELNHSVTTSDTSDVSSERDRESEV